MYKPLISLTSLILAWAVIGQLGVVNATVWTNAAGDGDWINAGNWDNGLPNAGERADIESISDMTWPTLAGGTAECDQMRLGYTETMIGELTVTGGGILNIGGELRLGRKPSEPLPTGTLYISGAATEVLVAQRIECGRYGNGIIDISGGLLHTDAELRLGFRDGGSGTVYLRGGTVHVEDNPGVTVAAGGDTGKGLIDISGFGTLSLAGDQVAAMESFVSDGTIVGYGGETPVLISYDLGTDTTRVKAPSPAKASGPSVLDEATDVLREVILTWTAGADAQSQNVYLGTVFADVNAATVAEPLGVLVSQAQDANAFDAGVLEFGQTYYWRVDGIGASPDHTVFRGDVWRFSVEPFSYPIERISAQASSSHEPNTGPEKTINGHGLNAMDQHSTVDTDMWLSGAGDPAVWIKYEFDKVYKLHEMWIWNSNQMIESFVGLGAKEVSIELSTDGNSWTPVEGANQLSQATGSADYTHNTVVDFAGALARYCRINIHSTLR